MEVFKPQKPVSEIAENILKKRYYKKGENSWEDVAKRVVNWVLGDNEDRDITYEMIANRYFIPNSPCLVNSGVEGGGLIACFVVPFEDSIEGIYRTKLEFALVAKKGGGCGTTLSFIRPEGASVAGSVHGYAGGPVKFFDTICHDMTAMTQAGFREMAMMGVMFVYHPDIEKFITAKHQEGKMHTTNISVLVDDAFMQAVKDDKTFQTRFGDKVYTTYRARDIFDLIVESAWKNGEPGLLFDNAINNSPYNEAGIKIHATNPCGEQPLPPYGSCNLGSIDVSKFLKEDNTLELELLELATRLSVRFLDSVIDRNTFPSESFEKMAKATRPVGLGIMGLADLYLAMGIAYGSKEALEVLTLILSFMKNVAEDESIQLGEKLGVPEACKKLHKPRRNITVLSIAPTGTISLLAGCNSGIEPFFSEVTKRVDKTGEYEIAVSDLPEHFRCAVSANGAKEVTWEEHIATQAVAQKFVDSGVSKTINFPTHTHKETIGKAFMRAWESGCKGITIYRNGSRDVEVLSPKNIKKSKCPLCGSQLISESGCYKCINADCGYSFCQA
jgi:ribonucleoside-diphosphate reductase alpha chain